MKSYAFVVRENIRDKACDKSASGLGNSSHRTTLNHDVSYLHTGVKVGFKSAFGGSAQVLGHGNRPLSTTMGFLGISGIALSQ